VSEWWGEWERSSGMGDEDVEGARMTLAVEEQKIKEAG